MLRLFTFNGRIITRKSKSPINMLAILRTCQMPAQSNQPTNELDIQRRSNKRQNRSGLLMAIVSISNPKLSPRNAPYATRSVITEHLLWPAMGNIFIRPEFVAINSDELRP